jgi:hypothetical protein
MFEKTDRTEGKPKPFLPPLASNHPDSKEKTYHRKWHDKKIKNL